MQEVPLWKEGKLTESGGAQRDWHRPAYLERGTCVSRGGWPGAVVAWATRGHPSGGTAHCIHTCSPIISAHRSAHSFTREEWLRVPRVRVNHAPHALFPSSEKEKGTFKFSLQTRAALWSALSHDPRVLCLWGCLAWPEGDPTARRVKDNLQQHDRKAHLCPGAQIPKHGFLVSKLPSLGQILFFFFFFLQLISIKSFPLKSKYTEKRLVVCGETFPFLQCTLSTISGLPSKPSSPQVPALLPKPFLLCLQRACCPSHRPTLPSHQLWGPTRVWLGWDQGRVTFAAATWPYKPLSLSSMLPAGIGGARGETG